MPKSVSRPATALEVIQMKRLGATLRARRMALRLRIEDMQRKTGIDYFAIRAIEVGHRDARFTTQFLPLCKVLELDPKTILDEMATQSPTRSRKDTTDAAQKLPASTRNPAAAPKRRRTPAD